MNYASVCDGIGAAHCAWDELGWTCAWSSEIEKFPIAVVEHRWGIPNLGDMTALTEETVASYGSIDLFVGGTPCQSFSIAGKRLGLDDPRGNLALRFCQLAAVLCPRWIVWENVPGVLSSNRGSDFACFIRGMANIGYFGAWRVLDAQYFGVPQRRRRVFAVFSAGDWRRAAAVLFEPQSVCGNSSQGGCEWRADSVGIEGGTAIAYGITGDHTPKHGENVMPTLRAEQGGEGRCVAFNWQSGGDVRLGVSEITQATIHGAAIRRLTPRECERLQGFPDDYTRISWRGKPADECPDGPRYKALGNSMAVPVMKWIGKRIAAVQELCN